VAVAATVTVERTQLIGRVNMARHQTPTHTLSMDVRDCIRYKNALKLFVRSGSKSVTARFATKNPAKSKNEAKLC